jgi:hypothetical protein
MILNIMGTTDSHAGTPVVVGLKNYEFTKSSSI